MLKKEISFLEIERRASNFTHPLLKFAVVNHLAFLLKTGCNKKSLKNLIEKTLFLKQIIFHAIKNITTVFIIVKIKPL